MQFNLNVVQTRRLRTNYAAQVSKASKTFTQVRSSRCLAREIILIGLESTYA